MERIGTNEIEVLQLLEGAEHPLDATEIASAVRLPPTATELALSHLQAEGLVVVEDRDGHGYFVAAHERVVPC